MLAIAARRGPRACVTCVFAVGASVLLIAAGRTQEVPASEQCTAALTYIPLDGAEVGRNAQGVAALGTYERISPDGRFILRSYSGERVGKVSLMELPANGAAGVKVYRTPFSNEAFPVQGSWRYLVDVTGEHYRFSDILRQQQTAKPLFHGGMTGFYAAASEMPRPGAPAYSTSAPTDRQPVFIRSLSWPQGNNSDDQGVGPLQVETIEVRDDGVKASLIRSSGARFICSRRVATDGSVYALPMISIDGTEFSAIPQVPRTGAPSMRVYGLGTDTMATDHPCDLRADLGLSPAKAVFGFPDAKTPARLTYSDLGHVYVFDRDLKQTFRLDHAKDRVLASAFPGLTRDGRVIYGATWRDCASAASCPEQAGYVIADPYQSTAYRQYWATQGKSSPRACITLGEVNAERARFARQHGLPD